ncbi:carbonic anhydrase 2-like [Drosophila innubila]|uniref:carbonic anhydrase 2-like n=1 Tax=Drosophila innubila TaxID=198719 RepID=UPI00148CC699|nr:carbonic anhydrase 2-like [Drosophila innubila]
MILYCTILLNIFSVIRSEYNYDQQGADWTGTCRYGRNQSPIDLTQKHATMKHLPRIEFEKYDLALRTPLLLVNNGHTAHMELPPVGHIKGGMLRGKFVPQSVHFHWGSLISKGSEHAINNERYDAEIHIIHKNSRYWDKSVGEASQLPNGIAVLAVMIKSVLREEESELNKVFEALPQIIPYKSNTTIYGRLTMKQLLGNIDTGKFYTYKGSLTTPDCTELVTWTVFKEVVSIRLSLIANFWSLTNSHGQPLINNYRELQDIHRRKVYYRSCDVLKKLLDWW